MIIKAYGQQAFGGRTEDTFVIPDYDTIEELNDIINSNKTIICYEPMAYYHWTIVEKESLYQRIVNLSKYLKIKKVIHPIMTREEIKSLQGSVCKGCHNNNNSLSAGLRCRYEQDENGGCKNKEEELFFSLFKRNKKKKEA